MSTQAGTPLGSARFLKRTLLGLWALWLTLVFTTNVMDALKALDLVPATMPFASGNYLYLVETTARYRPPAWVNGLLFAGVICWEGVAALLFWRAWQAYRGQDKTTKETLYIAFTVGLSLWLAFVIADEICIAYLVSGTHWRLFTAMLATLLAIELLPEEVPTPPVGRP